MKERPILFSGPMMCRILAGQKTQTRRIIKPQPALDRGSPSRCPYGHPGDLLWCREGWALQDYGPDEYPTLVYRADRQAHHADPSNGSKSPPFQLAADWQPKRWRSSLHMPRWASRATLEVTAVRAERLKDITDVDACAEGFMWRAGFIRAWIDMHGRGSWTANPWVWVVSFALVGQPAAA